MGCLQVLCRDGNESDGVHNEAFNGNGRYGCFGRVKFGKRAVLGYYNETIFYHNLSGRERMIECLRKGRCR